jgi:hypothetical protein
MRPDHEDSMMCSFSPRLLPALALASLTSSTPAWAAAEMKSIAHIQIEEGVIHEAIAFDDGGGKLAYAETDGKGKTRLRVGAPGGKTAATDLTSFTQTPEKILFLGGHWFVVSNEGTRRAAVVAPNGRIKREIGPFTDCFVSNARGKAFVTVTDKGDKAQGHVYDIAAYRPDGQQLGGKLVTIAADGTLVGTEHLVFVAFTGGYLQALVKKPGRYDAKADVRGVTQLAVLDILSGKTGPAKAVSDLPRFLRFVEKRAEKPGLETFVRLDDDAAGLELVGPGDKLRPLKLPEKLSLYETGSLQQQASGGRLFFSLTVDPLNPEQVAAHKKGPRVLHLYEAAVGAARATRLGEIPLGETQAYVWAAGGNKLAVVKRTQASGGNEIAIFSR